MTSPFFPHPILNNNAPQPLISTFPVTTSLLTTPLAPVPTTTPAIYSCGLLNVRQGAARGYKRVLGVGYWMPGNNYTSTDIFPVRARLIYLSQVAYFDLGDVQGDPAVSLRFRPRVV